MKTRIEIRAHREPFVREQISLRIAHFSESESGTTVALALPIQFKMLSGDEMTEVMPPTMSLTPADAQQFMDELWRTGIRPTEGAGSVGQMAATVKHLEDMRRLVFDGPNIANT